MFDSGTEQDKAVDHVWAVGQVAMMLGPSNLEKSMVLELLVVGVWVDVTQSL